MKLGNAYVKDQPYENLFEIKERFIRGNSFKDLYSFYKYIPEIPKNLSNKERVLLLIQQYNFALIDLGLYLDTHPENLDCLKDYLFINEELKKLKCFYINNYEPLEMSSYSKENFWKWSKNNMPWEGDISVEV